MTLGSQKGTILHYVHFFKWGWGGGGGGGGGGVGLVRSFGGSV